MWLNRKHRVVAASVVALAAAMCLIQALACAAAPADKDSKDKAKQEAQADAEPPKDLAPQGCRYWTPFERLPIDYDYVAGLFREGKLSFYLACNHPQHPGQETALLTQTLEGGKKGPHKILFSSKIIDDVYDPADANKKAPFVQMARTAMYYDEKAGYVCLNSLFPGEYGKSSLVPALFSSPTGEPDTWKYHGKLKGEPAVYEKEMKKKHWYGEGAIVRAADDRWRTYLCGYGVTMAAAESASLDGPWTFVRDAAGKMKNVAEAAPLGAGKGGGACFPYALKVSDKEYHIWLSEGWPCKSVWHLTSENGLDFKLYGKQPEISPAAAGCRAMKGVRAFLSPDGKTIYGWIPFMPADSSNPSGWVIHQSTLPVGLQPQ